MFKKALAALAALALPAMAVLAAPAAADCPGNPKALGVSRVVEIDTTGGPGFGFDHFKDHDFLRPKEVVLTFDDGPWPGTTVQVLKALADHCTKAMFFVIGKHALWHPDILRQVAAGGHTIATHTFSHLNLASKKLDEAKRKAEIEMGISAVRRSLGEDADRVSSFFRFPMLSHPTDMVAYVGERNLGIWSTDIDSMDFRIRDQRRLVSSVMQKLDRRGKGIVLLHDFQRHTAQATRTLLDAMQAGGYQIVEVRSKDTVQSLPEYDAEVALHVKGPTSANARPTSSIVRTISEADK